MRLFLCGDVMTGRGIDQILAHPDDPQLYEPWVHSALDYVALAERASGPIPHPVGADYIWGDALAELAQWAPDLRIINLETSITRNGQPEPKTVNYRMNPANIGCLTAASIDCCVLANNHVADWGLPGLETTLKTLHAVGIATAGAGESASEAERPATLKTQQGARLRVFALGSPSSGVPIDWAAGAERPGVNLLAHIDRHTVRQLAAQIERWSEPDDVVLVSIHWGSNWVDEIPLAHRRFAHALIDEAGVDIVHGHSSHHPLAMEVHAGRAILYGCGDFINDYEGIGGHEELRPELVLGYLLDVDDREGTLRALHMLPFRLSRFRLQQANSGERAWLRTHMDSLCRPFGHDVKFGERGSLRLD